MFNYQSRVYSEVFDAIKNVNISKAEVYDKLREIQNVVPPEVHQGAQYLGGLYQEWQTTYNHTFHRFQPQIRKALR